MGVRNLVKLSHFGYGKAIKGSSWTCFCKGDWEGERGLELKLEAEILEFMKGSEKPAAFPTKAELVEAGRRDLVEAIVKRGGWLSMGWDLEEEEMEMEMEMEGVGDERHKIEENGEMGNDYCEVTRSFDESVDRFREDSSSASISFSHAPSISGRSFEMRDEEEDSGVQGILTRLEKERNLSFSASLGRQPLIRNNSNDWLIEASGDVDSDNLRRSQRFSSGSSSEGILTGGKFSHSKFISDVDGSWSSLKPEMVKTWTIPRASFSSSEYEASEVSSCDSQFHEAEDDPKDRIIAVSEGSSEVLDEKGDNISRIDLRTRLQHLELQLTSTLCTLRSKSEGLNSKEGYEPFTEMQKLSDALEFQETEIMNAKDDLRSIRAKLAVLEGKMTLAIIDTRKTIDEKQRKIDSARRALQMLRITSIVWPNSASEVFLAGSFDGWTTQRRMMQSSSGIFSVDLKLYPGKYEIKFIVDGVWKVDPLRPIVKNGGYENNLFIVT